MSTTQTTTATLRFEAKLEAIGTWTILRVPAEASAKLPSRGQVMVEGTVNGIALQTPLEPDGKFSHWFRVDASLLKAMKAKVGDTVQLEVRVMKDWPEPDLPVEWRKALSASPEAFAVWQQATPMAHWEWLRWIRSTGRDETRQRRLQVGISKLKAGERRPCCWNRNLCTEPSVSKNGVLLEKTA